MLSPHQASGFVLYFFFINFRRTINFTRKSTSRIQPFCSIIQQQSSRQLFKAITSTSLWWSKGRSFIQVTLLRLLWKINPLDQVCNCVLYLICVNLPCELSPARIIMLKWKRNHAYHVLVTIVQYYLLVLCISKSLIFLTFVVKINVGT